MPRVSDFGGQKSYIHRNDNLKSHLTCCVIRLTKFWPLVHQTILFLIPFNLRVFRSGYLFLPEVPVSEQLVHTVVEVEVQK